MSGTTSTPGGGSLDLSQFFQVFFEEAAENLERMEQLLLGIDLQAADDETLNAIFRCAHSVKGGAATFGFSDLADLTHDMETLLDRLRRRELAPSVAMVDVLLQSGDAMRAHLDRYRSGAEANGVDDGAVRASLRSLAEGGPTQAAAPVAAPAEAPVAAPLPGVGTKEADAPVAAAEPRVLELVVGPLEAPEQADQLFELFREIEDLGTIERLDAGQAAEGIRRFRVHTTSSDADLLDLFTFHVDRERVRLQPISDGYGFHEGAPGAPAPQPATVDPQPLAPGAEAALPDASDADFAGARGAG
ncbi:MAG: chemotaxis protein CheA, partial [Burkholderiales bacterium]